jgi:hypothetical protein
MKTERVEKSNFFTVQKYVKDLGNNWKNQYLQFLGAIVNL